jgi:iron complex outermembrane receptor protein
VILAYTNQDVRVTKSENGDVGQRFPNIPRNLATLWTTYEFQQDMLKGLKIGGGVIYHGSQPVLDISRLYLSPMLPLLPDYATVNLMAAYSFKLADAKMTAQVNITNLFDTTYYTEGVNRVFPSSKFSFGNRLYGAPFTVMNSLRAEF